MDSVVRCGRNNDGVRDLVSAEEDMEFDSISDGCSDSSDPSCTVKVLMRIKIPCVCLSVFFFWKVSRRFRYLFST